MKNLMITAPTRAASVREDNRAEYLRQLKLAGMKSVFLGISDFGSDPNGKLKDFEALASNIAYLKENGIEAGVWFGNTVGHGSPLVGTEENESEEMCTPLVNIMGEVIHGTRCPLDEKFIKALENYVTDIVKTGAKTILIDDDLRLSQHGSEFCCACDKHLGLMSEISGEKVTRADLRKRAFSGKPNKIRDAWFKAEGESLKRVALAIRRAIDREDPSVRVGLCLPHCLWDIDGADPIELADILSGGNKPLLRLHSAPYSSTISVKPLPLVFELARMFPSFCKDKGVELLAEGDVYPRPRYFVPSSHLELYDAVIRANGGFDGIIKYIFDYVSEPDYETGYLERHVRMLPLNLEIEELFSDKVQCGVSVSVRPHLLNSADLSISPARQLSPYPWAGIFLSLNSIPTTYTEDGICSAVFGEEGRHVSDARISNGAVLDAVSALILKERGIDVGLSSFSSFTDENITELYSENCASVASVWKGSARLMKAELEGKATVVEYAGTGVEKIPLAYRYENKSGQRFLVYMFDASAFPYYPYLLRGYLGQRILTDGVEWVADKKLPAVCEKNPDLYVMCAKSKDGGSLAVALFNCYPDSMIDPVIKLDREYKTARFIGCTGRLDGDKVILTGTLPAYEYCAFEVE